MRAFFRRHRYLILALALLAPCLWFMSQHAALAQGVSSGELLPDQVGETIGTGAGDIRITIARIIRTAFGILGTVALLLILYAGFVWMTAAGDDEKIQRAKKTLTAAVIGLVIMLSAFAIVSYILSALVSATGGTISGGGGVGGGGGGGGGGFTPGGGGAFRPTAIQPKGSLGKYDVTPAITFSATPTDDAVNIKANILLEKVSGSSRTSVDYEPVVENSTIRLRPITPCPAPNASRRCLDQNSDYQITVRAGLKNASSSAGVSCGLGATCSQSFKTGSNIRTEPPTIVISSPVEGQSVPAGDLVPLQAIATDQDGIASVEYSADGAFFAADGNAQQIAPSTYASQAVWDTASVAPGKTVSLSARAVNIDGDEKRSVAVRVTVRPQFCFNHVKDGDEAAVDCGGSCGACSGGACTQNSSCSSGLCQNGQCVENPQITDVQLRDGKPGNLVTITGLRLGTSGKVTFLGTAAAGDEKEAAPAACGGAWSSGRIVVVVPEGAKSGPIQVEIGGKKDGTNDAYGPIISDFQINDVARPGICSVTPIVAKAGVSLTVTGAAFGAAQSDSRVQFARAGADCSQIQDWTSSAEASQVSPWSATSLQPTVPNLQTDADGSFFLLRVTVGGQSSNTACVRIDPPEAGTEPRITFVTPEDGSVGTYVSIFGANFGSGGTVRFKNASGEAIGDVSFPAQCAAGYWTGSSVTVKVPARFTTPANTAVELAQYNVTVLRSDGRASNAVSFTINTDPVPPGLCRIEPDNGPVGTPVTLYGEGFGSISSTDLPAYLTQHPDAVRFNENKNASSVSQWQSSAISASVPDGATTGPVRVRTFSGAIPNDSNAVNFQVRDCKESGGTASCGSGRTCCDDGACRASCGASGAIGGFAWQFSTGAVPVFPIVVENATCQVSPPSSMPSPNPFKGMTDVCTDMGAVAVRFSLPMDPATLNSSNVVFEACGTGAAISSTCSAVAGIGSPSALEYDPEGRTQLVLPISGLQPNTWYKLTIRDQVRSLGTAERAAQSLDGNFDNKAGGAYITTFKTGPGNCALSGVDVQPANALISAADETKKYQAFPLSSTCVILSCSGRAVSWNSSDPGKATVVSLGGTLQCEAVVTPVSETDPGPPIDIRSTVDGLTDFGKLTVDYANPRIVSYGPRDCTEACVNTVGFAYFNTPMADSGPGSVLSNVKLYKCRNESCLTFEGEVALVPDYNDAAKLLTFGNPALVANTWYRAVVLGTAMSTSQAPLTGLNYDDNAFSWIFRTRLAGDPCGPQKVLLEPPQTTLRYVGEVSPITALPVSSPDKCSANGQLLNADSYNWSWSKAQNPASPQSFAFLPDVPPGTLLNTNPKLLAGCSSNCLMTGSKPAGTPSCGNGKLETGEECDTPGLNGCNASCLRTGNTISNGCGDGTLQPDRGEECDAGTQNGTAISGCTAACLLVGSSPGLSACGNGSVGVGEACDDSNSQNGDGCSSRCLYEGSQQNVYVCGNGTLEPGEQCDYILDAGGLATQLLVSGRAPSSFGASDERNPTKPNFACGQSCLLRGNTATCAAGTNCCGNGIIEPVKGENCDAGGQNGKPASGCSSLCTKTGSDPALHAFCGDTIVTVKSADPLTGVQNGGGEECEAAALDANIDAVQVLEARNQCDAKNSCTASVSAAIGAVSGQGSVSVECSCRVDSDCSAFGSNLSCGAGACCFPRPAAPDITPKGGDECRNAQITVQFGEEMNIGTLQGGIVVESCGPTTYNGQGIRSWLARAASSVSRFVRSLIGMEASAADVCSPIEGSFTHVAKVSPDDTTRTVSTFAPRQVFSPNRKYRVTVKGGPNGVKTVKGVGYPAGGDTVQEFATGSDICSFDVVQTSPATELIQDSSTPLTITATAMTNRGGQLEAITPIAGVYDWSWNWATVPENATVGALLDLTAASAAPSAAVQAKRGVNGREQVVATAKITADTALTPPTLGQEKIGKSQITILLCQLPWPRRDVATGAWAPYVDPQTHFEFYYCRDNAASPLPELMEGPVQGRSAAGSGLLRFCATTHDADQSRACVTDADCNAGDSCQSKDLLFRFQPEWKLSDAVGMRVFENPNRLTPQEWYLDQHFSGQTQPATVDGYQAVKDERTVYVGAADKYGDPDLRAYVYVFAFNEKADPRTGEIFDRLIKNVRFNTNLVPADAITNVCKNSVGDLLHPSGGSSALITCTSDLDCKIALPGGPAGMSCDSDKDKIRRDMRRWQDIRDIEKTLETTHAQTGFYPKIESGSFVRGFTTSKWPSWGQQLGATAVDPLNVLNRCDAFGSECSVSRKACTSDADCTAATGDTCRPLFEAETCYSEKVGIFACPADSHVYQYRSIGGVDYRMSVDFEYVTYQWVGSACAPKSNQVSCDAAIGCSWLPTGPTSGICQTRVSTTPVCTGIPSASAPKKCLATGVVCVSSDQCDPQDACVPSEVPLVGPAAGKACGNGLLEADEECEVGQTRNNACSTGGQELQRCGSACTWETVTACPGAAACGNGSLETFAGESCDDGAQNGQYGRCRSGNLGCAKRCVNITKRAAFDGNCSDGSCDLGPTCATNADCSGQAYASVCTDRMNFCGDGVKNGSEACDDGARNGQYGYCAWDCRGPGPRCGDNTTNGAEQCDANQASAPGVCIASGSSLADTATAASASVACSKDSDCGSGLKCALCAVTSGGLPQTRTKGCFPASAPAAQACTFDAWSACKPSGACGNGVMEGAEECDAGAGNSPNGACLTTCKKNVCNDGFVQSGIEQCDNGASNGVRCTPQYGLTCNYCKNDCSIETISGAFCGDKIIQAPPESCDPGPVAAWCSRTYTNLSDASAVKGCLTDNDCLPGVCKNYPGASGGAAEGAVCRSSSDCAASQFCQGGEGQCIAYNTQCRPEPYTNIQAAASAKKCQISGASCTSDSQCGASGPCVAFRFDGACNYCSNACAGTTSRSPAFCGDSVKQTQFGEQCDGSGDPQAMSGSGSSYACRADCQYDLTAGYCGDSVAQAPPEKCDGSSFPGGIPACSDTVRLGRDMGVGRVSCSLACGYYTAGCSNGDLLPGDFRFKFNWPTPHNNDNESDLYVKAMYWPGPLAGQSRFFGWTPGSNPDPRYVGSGNLDADGIELFWDVTDNVHPNDPEIMVISTKKLPPGTYHVFANAGTCFENDDHSEAADFDRNAGWFKGAGASTKANTVFSVESGSPQSISGVPNASTSQKLSSVPNVSGNPCLWYIGYVEKADGASEGRFTMRNVYLNKADGPVNGD